MEWVSVLLQTALDGFEAATSTTEDAWWVFETRHWAFRFYTYCFWYRAPDVHSDLLLIYQGSIDDDCIVQMHKLAWEGLVVSHCLRSQNSSSVSDCQNSGPKRNAPILASLFYTHGKAAVVFHWKANLWDGCSFWLQGAWQNGTHTFCWHEAVPMAPLQSCMVSAATCAVPNSEDERNVKGKQQTRMASI